MKSRGFQQLMRVLIGLLGAGVGVALTMGGLQLFRYTAPLRNVPIGVVLTAYAGMAILFGVGCYVFAKPIVKGLNELYILTLNRVDAMPVGQLLSSILGLIVGFVIAALLSQILQFMGDSIFTTTSSAILFLVLGLLGYTIARRRSKDLVRFVMQLNGLRGKRFRKKAGKPLAHEHAGAPVKVLDTSVLIDGRILEVCRAGFVEGELVVPEFVLSELRHVADSADVQRRARGRRGLDVLQKMQETLKQPVRIDNTNYADTEDVDVKLLRLARSLNATVVTGDYNLNKAAQVTGIRAMNLNELAGALRPVLRAGDELNVVLTKEGKEPGQGVAYLDDGTMVVVDGGRAHMGENVDAVVTTVLQTSAGRMVFAKLRADD